MSGIRCTVEVAGDDVLVDLQGGGDKERIALLNRVGEWAEQNRQTLGMTGFRLISGDRDEELLGASVAIDEDHCHECAARKTACWLKSLGLEVWL